MRQIFSWTVGSFFRTIGRTVALLAMGALLYYIASSLGFGLKDLFFDNVKADGIYVDGYDTAWYSGNNRADELSRNGWYNYRTGGTTNDINGAFTTLDFYTKSGGVPVTNIKGGEIRIPFYVSAPTLNSSVGSTSTDTLTCRNWNCTTTLQSGGCQVYRCNEWYTSQNQYTTYDFEYLPPQVDMSAFVVYNTGYLDVCQINKETSEIICPIAVYDNIEYINFIRIQARVVHNPTTSTDNAYYIGLFRKINRYKNSTNAIIDSQNQNTQSIIQQEQNSTNQLLDTNSTATDSKADSFFGSFDSNETYGGLSSIVTAPLVVVNEMLSNTCVAPSATWKGATISLPCGDMFWNRPGADDLKNLLNVFYGGFICYYAIRKLFLMIENFKDPTHDKIEVTDL